MPIIRVRTIRNRGSFAGLCGRRVTWLHAGLSLRGIDPRFSRFRFRRGPIGTRLFGVRVDHAHGCCDDLVNHRGRLRGEPLFRFLGIVLHNVGLRHLGRRFPGLLGIRGSLGGAVFLLLLAAGLLGLLLDQPLPVGDGNLVVVRMDFAEGKEAVPVAAVLDEGSL